MKMEQTECSETLAYKIQTPENYPEESIQQSTDSPNPDISPVVYRIRRKTAKERRYLILTTP